MPGVRPYGFRFGDRAEYLSGYILSGLSFVVQVPKSEDVGHDLFCTLTKQKGNLIQSGPSFSVQVKNRKQELIYEKEYEISWIKTLENPFFICIADNENLKIRIYTTWNRLSSKPFANPKRIVLSPGNKDDTYQQATFDDGTLLVPLGKPILEISTEDSNDQDKCQYFSSIFRQWITIDRHNIVNMDAGLHWIFGPHTYETNEQVKTKNLLQYFFSPPVKRKDLHMLLDRNLKQSVTAKLFALQRKISIDENAEVNIEMINVLRKVLRLQIEHLNEGD
jgi:hypothetical protein